MPAPLRDRILAAAAARTVDQGWARVTMGRLAADVGVSRQTVHHEIGTKADLAQALVLRELATFLDRVERAFAEHPDDVGAAIRGAVTAVLEHAESSPMLRAVVSASHGAATELLPLLTTSPELLLETTSSLILDLVEGYDLPVPQRRIELSVDVIVRTVVSQVMYPTTTPAEAADHLAWIVEEVVAARR